MSEEKIQGDASQIIAYPSLMPYEALAPCVVPASSFPGLIAVSPTKRGDRPAVCADRDVQHWHPAAGLPAYLVVRGRVRVFSSQLMINRKGDEPACLVFVTTGETSVFLSEGEEEKEGDSVFLS